MLVTIDEGDWGAKVGFVDENGACLEYPIGLDAGWFASEAEPLFYGGVHGDCDLGDYNFDPTYIRRESTDVYGSYTFRLVSDDKPDLYLVLFNLSEDRQLMFKSPEAEPVYGVI